MDMPNLQNLPAKLRIKRYQAEVQRHQKQSGRTSQLMLRVYKELLEAAEAEIANQTPTPPR